MFPRPPLLPPNRERQAAAELIAEALRKRILSGELAGGQPLRQDAIADRFGVSHIPVREALRQLAAEGLVTIRPNRGSVVSELVPDEARELLEIRGALETQALRWALPRSDAALVKKARRILERMERTPEVREWLGLNWQFHFLLYERAERPLLFAMLGSLNAKVERYIRVVQLMMDNRKQTEMEHRAILAAYEVRNVEAACSLLSQHLTDTARQLEVLIEKHRPRTADLGRA